MNVARYKSWMFTIGAVFAGIGGALYVHYLSFISPDSFSVNFSILMIMILAIGGRDSLFGAFLGAVVVTLLPIVLSGYEAYSPLVFGILFVMAVMFMPSGAAGVIRLCLARLKSFRRPAAANREKGTGAMILRLEHLSRRYGGVTAVDDVSFAVKEGTITALIGPNGAGKTTTLNMISGMTPPSEGRVYLAGGDATGLRADEMCRQRMARTFQMPQTFGSMTLRENVVVGSTTRGVNGLISAALQLPRFRSQEAGLVAEAIELLSFMGIGHLADISTSDVSFGVMRLTELARALAADPVMILMDEPASGLSARGNPEFAGHPPEHQGKKNNGPSRRA